ncbi:MAG: acylphosphatase [Gammaproteobacteria bacterium]|nr:acylphosphatase [Gammaproteobacteria bacterium]MDH3857747.1 acylphosphatase [Gammaproteobacteria bacterium]
MDQVRSVTGFVSGRVQGVGFRYFVMRHAQAENLGGFVRNLDDGRVQFLLQGEAGAVAKVIEKIRIGPAHARVSDLVVEHTDKTPLTNGFVIR